MDDPALPGLTLRKATPRPGTVVVAAAGECDLHDAPRLEAALAEAARDATRVLVDLSELRFADSTTLGVILKTRRTLEGGGRELALVSPSPEVRRTLSAAGLAGVFRLADAAEAGNGDAAGPALATGGSPPEPASIFRSVNERILELAARWDPDETVEFLCECRGYECMRPVPLSRAAYERIRSTAAGCAIVHPAHGDAGWQVVESGRGYLVVAAAAGAGEAATAHRG